MKYVWVNQLPPQVKAELTRDCYRSICESLCVEHEHIEEAIEAMECSKLDDVLDSFNCGKVKYLKFIS